jgi:hypothetical protein
MAKVEAEATGKQLVTPPGAGPQTEEERRMLCAAMRSNFLFKAQMTIA